MKLRLPSSALLLCLSFGLVATAQSAEPGWYLLGHGGQSSASGLGQGQVDDNLVAIYNSVGLDVLTASSTLDDSDTGFGLGGGIQVNDNFAFEFVYVNLGSIDYQSSGTVSDGVDTFAAEADLSNSVDGAVLSVLGILPVGERFSVFGRAGLSLLSVEGKARITVDGISQRDSQSTQTSDPVLGIGAEYSVSDHFAVRLAWDRYLDVGTNDVMGDTDVDYFSLGVRMSVGWFR
ncbi:MAG: outer membrane beta-barrel protein [Rhodobacteraceae bacterium]|nr:outer membrane beta-barrel protein [Paracoccaceae bacterium]